MQEKLFTLSSGHRWSTGISWGAHDYTILRMWLAGEKLLTGEACAIAQCVERLRLLPTPWPLRTKQPEEKQLSWHMQPEPGSADRGQGQPGGDFISSLLFPLLHVLSRWKSFVRRVIDRRRQKAQAWRKSVSASHGKEPRQRILESEWREGTAHLQVSIASCRYKV